MKRQKIRICDCSFYTKFIIFILGFIFGVAPKTWAGDLKVSIDPNQNTLITNQIQAAIDSCTNNGGGVVHFAEGTYLTGSIKLRSNVTLQFDKGAILQGSDNYLDYGSGKWSEGLIVGDSLENIRILGEGLIDGVNCKNPKGEEGFRGPHAIRLTNCRNLTIKGITIVRSANWAINCRYSTGGVVENVTIRGGHDGLHTRFCSNFKVKGCDFRTGDDCFAGNDNRDFEISDCKVNTSCNGFRFGCYNLTVKDCKIWGPGEYKHLSQNRNNMLSAFVHFSPKDDNSKLASGNWLIQNVTIEKVDNIYNYNYNKGLWQTGLPAHDVTFDKIEAKDILNGFNIKGDTARQFKLSIQNSSFEARSVDLKDSYVFEGVPLLSPSFINIESFDQLIMKNVIFQAQSQKPVIYGTKGNVVSLDKICFESQDPSNAVLLKEIQNIRKKKLK